MFENLKAKMAGAKTRLLLAAGSSTTLVASVSAAEINWTSITSILSGVVNIFPTILDLVVAIFPIVIVITIIGFVVGFLDKILAMLKI